MAPRRSSLVTALGAALTALVFAYIVLRAWSIGLTPDEATTYLVHARATWWDILTFARPIKSNNHLLNTLLIKISTLAFGDSEFVIRLPALGGAVLYLVSTHAVLRRLLPDRLFLAGLTLLVVNPFLIEFLSLARGYALGLGFMMASVFYLVRWVEEPESERAASRLTVALALLAIAVLAVLPFLNVWAGVVSTIVVLTVLGLLGQPFSGRMLLRLARGLAPGVILLVLVLLFQIYRFFRHREFYYGGREGFFENTIGSLVSSLSYSNPHIPEILVQSGRWLAVGLVVACGLVGIRLIVQRPAIPIARTLLLITGTIVFGAIAISSQHALFGMPYVIGRTAIYFVPLAFLQWLVVEAWFTSAQSPGWACRSTTILAYAVSLGIFVHGVQSLNLTHTVAWKGQADTRAAMQVLASQYQGTCGPPESVVMKVTWWLGPGAEYYKKRFDLGCLKLVIRQSVPDDVDWLYMSSDALKTVRLGPLRIVANFALSDTQLAVREPR